MTAQENSGNKLLSTLLFILVPLLVIVTLWIGWRTFYPEQPTIFAATQPENLGVTSGELTDCPSSPNCVSSQSNSEDEEHYIAPLNYEGDTAAAEEKLEELVQDFPRTNIVTSEENYLYAEFATPLMGFVDDVEFYLHDGTIEVRSASRLGESDLGVNRKRIENIREQWQEVTPNPGADNLDT